MRFMKRILGRGFLVAAAVLLVGLSACQKEKDYYLDSGLANPYFKGSVVDYLQSKPFYFDSVSNIIQLAGMDSIFRTDTVTFFAPTDRSVLRLIEQTNNDLYYGGYDTIRALTDVPASLWRKYLTRYLFHGANHLKDYPQIDYDLLNSYPGQGYLSWDRTPMNIGVIYNDVNDVKYAGYRQLSIAYIPDISEPTSNWILALVASSDIQTNNGTVQVLSDAHQYFGFDEPQFFADIASVFAKGIK